MASVRDIPTIPGELFAKFKRVFSLIRPMQYSKLQSAWCAMILVSARSCPGIIPVLVLTDRVELPLFPAEPASWLLAILIIKESLA